MSTLGLSETFCSLKAYTVRNPAVEIVIISRNETACFCLEDLSHSDTKKQPQFPTEEQSSHFRGSWVQQSTSGNFGSWDHSSVQIWCWLLYKQPCFESIKTLLPLNFTQVYPSPRFYNSFFFSRDIPHNFCGMRFPSLECVNNPDFSLNIGLFPSGLGLNRLGQEASKSSPGSC